MTTTTMRPDRAAGPSQPGPLARRIRTISVLTGRNLVHIAREPLQLSDVTIQPVLFTALFVYVFGSGVVLPHGGSYADFAIAGMLALNLTTSAMGTAVGLSNDLNGGIIDRFRTLPMWRPAVLIGRSVTDLLTAAICAFFVAATGHLPVPGMHHWMRSAPLPGRSPARYAMGVTGATLFPGGQVGVHGARRGGELRQF